MRFSRGGSRSRATARAHRIVGSRETPNDRHCEERPHRDEAISRTGDLPLAMRSRGSTTLPLAILISAFVVSGGHGAEIASAPDTKAVLSTFEIHPDFKIELAASEPQVFSPVDVEFDERGRPFVVEMLGYPFPDSPGRVVVLDDKDGDGIYETRTVFAEGFAMADSLLPYNGGLLVVSPPEILFLKDTNGDDVADVREVVFTGLILENPQHNVNGLSHGLDNWIYAANGGNSGTVTWADGSSKLALRFDDFRFDPRRKLLERAGRSTGGYEITFDAWGRMFGTHNLEPLSHLVFPGSYLDGLPQPREGTLKALPDDIENGLVRIYPIGEQNTRVNHPEQSGYFSGSCGLRHYGGGAFGPEFEGNVFICDVVLNLIHRRILEPAGPSFIARRDDRAKAEFLASTDRAFRPVNMTVAPDGSLWVVDMHRVVIEHPEWIPEEFLKDMDVNAGKDQGRLFRIAPKGGLPRVKPEFPRNNLAAVVATLEHPNQWWRTTAQRLLVEWNDPRAVPLLESLARESKVPVARAHALRTLSALGGPTDALMLSAFRDTSPDLREQAVQIVLDREENAPATRAAVRALAEDPAPRVRMFAALAQSRPGAWEPKASPRALLSIFERDAADPYLRLALLPGMLRAPFDLLGAMFSGGDTPKPGDEEMTALLAEAAAPRLSAKQAAALLGGTAERAAQKAGIVQALIAGLATGLESNKAAFQAPADRRALAEALSPLLKAESLLILRESWRLARALSLESVPGQEVALRRAEAAAQNDALAPEVRAENLRILEFASFAQRADLLYALLDTRQPRELQREAIHQLQREGTNEVATRLISMWRLLGPETRSAAADTLLYKRHNHALLLSALEDSTISLGEMDFHLERRRALLHSKDPEVVRRAQALFTDAGVVTRKDAMEKMKPALKLAGNPAHGKELFTNLCAKCHRMGSEGGDLGPNLTEIYRKSRETLMHDILDPNAAADTKYLAYTIERKNGELVSGLIAEESDAAVTIRDANAALTIVPRADIKEMISGGLSLMPEELESGLDVQAFADLLAYLQERK